MTVFTKKEGSDDKENVKTEGVQVPKVIVSGSPASPSPPNEERDISNSGWVPMEGGNFDRPRKEKRSSSFGPLSIIRLSPSPLARTPSPTPPEYENYENDRFRRCAKASIIIFVLLGFGLGTGLYFYQKGLIAAAYQRGVYHGWNAATFSNRGIPERLEQNVEIDPAKSYEKIDVPRFGSNRPAVFLHDFKQNLTGIVDVMGKRCFVKQLDRNVVAAPNSLINMLRSMDSPAGVDAPRVVRETFRVGAPLSADEVTALDSFMISRHCAMRPVYMLQKMNPSEAEVRRKKRASDVMETLEFASMGGESVELDEIQF